MCMPMPACLKVLQHCGSCSIPKYSHNSLSPETSELNSHRRVLTISFTLYFLSHFAGTHADCVVVKYTAASSYYIGHRHIGFSGELCGSRTSASPCVSSACFSEFIVMHLCGQNIRVSCGQLVSGAVLLSL